MSNNVHTMMSPGYWENADFMKRLMTVRFPELVVLFVLGMIALSYQGSHSSAFFIPDVVSVAGNKTSTTASFNPLFAYPINLDGHECDPAELSLCLSDMSTERQQQACCTHLNDVDMFPSETVPNKLNYAIIFGVTVTVITFRTFLWRQVFPSAQGRTICNLFWVLVWWDSALSLLVTCAYTGTATAILKFGIGYPRPNYYALNIFSSIHESEREHLQDSSTLSTPSGHAAMSMCAFSMVAALLLSDAFHISRMGQFSEQAHYKLLGYAALGVMLLPIYIGVSRVYDYFHFSADVIAGWLLGLFFTTFTFIFHCDLKNFFVSVNEKKVTGPESEALSNGGA